MFAFTFGAALRRRALTARGVHSRALCTRRRAAQASANSDTRDESGDSEQQDKFQIVRHEPIFQRYQTVFQRDVRFPTGRTVSYDVLGSVHSDYKSVFVFPFNSASNRVTLLREYAPGRNEESLSFVAGMFDNAKHDSIHAAARAELSEEARLTGGQLMRLAQNVAADKYSLNEYYFFLAVDCVQDRMPAARDDDEWISEVFDVRLESVRAMIGDGLLNTPNSLLGMLALDRLRDMGFPTS